MAETRNVSDSLSPEVAVARYIKPLFRRFHLNKDLMIGLVGDTGSGKSLSAGAIAGTDFMIPGMPCWANIGIRFNVKVPGGYQVDYQAGRLSRNRLLNNDPEYWYSLIVLDEINIKFAEARRSSSNVNLWYSDLNQQKRKYEMPMIYTVIDEMYVDPRVRNITDVFIRCKDTALTPHGLMTQQPQGVLVQWTIFDMHGKLSGVPYHNNGNRPLCTVNVNLRNLWGVIDTREAQSKGTRKYTEMDSEDTGSDIEIEEDPEVVSVKREWGWLEPVAQQILHEGRYQVPVKEIYLNSEGPRRQVAQHVFSRKLNELFNIETGLGYVDGKQQRVFYVPESIFLGK